MTKKLKRWIEREETNKDREEDEQEKEEERRHQ